jgi:hypothetical protein
MEEDEVDDNAGFPIVINDRHDDETLICADDYCHTCIESIARVVLTPTTTTTPIEGAFSSPRMLSVREVPLSRGMIGQDGTARFHIDMKSSLVGCAMSTKLKNGIDNTEGDNLDSDDSEGNETPRNAVGGVNNNLQVIKLIFHHVDTGTKLELRLPLKSDMDDCGEGIDFCELKKPGKNNGCGESNGKNTASRYLLDNPDEDQDDNDDNYENEYDGDDGFLVNGSQDSHKSDDTNEFDCDDVDKNDDDNDDDDECQICNIGGDLIVCDGGDQQDGCGDSYHVLCIGRTVVPPGDWICMACSKAVGFDVGIEGHEYADEKIDSTSLKKTKPLVIIDLIGDSDDENNDDADDEIFPSRKTKCIKRKILHTPNSDSE